MTIPWAYQTVPRSISYYLLGITWLAGVGVGVGNECEEAGIGSSLCFCWVIDMPPAGSGPLSQQPLLLCIGQEDLLVVGGAGQVDACGGAGAVCFKGMAGAGGNIAASPTAGCSWVGRWGQGVGKGGKRPLP